MSMTREEIIQEYEGAVFANGLAAAAGNEEAAKSYELFKAGLDALRPITREQVEKVWRGEWIHAMPILGSGDEEIRCSKCGNIVGFETAFCPYCGSPMTDEAVNMVMKRLEEMRNET